MNNDNNEIKNVEAEDTNLIEQHLFNSYSPIDFEEDITCFDNRHILSALCKRKCYIPIPSLIELNKGYSKVKK